jgi:hypothetical protein
MLYRLLIDYEALEFLASLKKADQRLLRQRLKAIQDDPAQFSDYLESDPSGRPLHVNICAGYAVTYWEDFADRHIKVLEISEADRDLI